MDVGLVTNGQEQPPAVDAIPDVPVVQKPKRDSGYKRMKRRALIAEAQKAIADDLAKDVTALEGLVGTLLNQLERAARTNMTHLDRERILRMVADIRGHLNDEQGNGDNAVASAPGVDRTYVAPGAI